MFLWRLFLHWQNLFIAAIDISKIFVVKSRQLLIITMKIKWWSEWKNVVSVILLFAIVFFSLNVVLHLRISLSEWNMCFYFLSLFKFYIWYPKKFTFSSVNQSLCDCKSLCPVMKYIFSSVMLQMCKNRTCVFFISNFVKNKRKLAL